MTENKNYKKLGETKELILGHIYEDAYLTIKATQENVSLGDLLGEPSCGRISDTNDWCIVGGSTIIVWAKGEIVRIKDDDLYWVSDVRQKDEHTVELLIDPWSDISAIWEFNVITKKKNKIRDFPDYKDKEYTDDVVW